MKEVPEKHPEFDPETYTDPILEECYRIKAEISAQFEYYKYLKAVRKKANGMGKKRILIRLNTRHPKNLKTITNQDSGNPGSRCFCDDPL